MKFCNFCAKISQQVKQINENKVKCGAGILKIKDLLDIFQSRAIKFILDQKKVFICNSCLKKLKNSFEFVQQIKESENKLCRGKEIKIEHDYFETKKDDENVTTNMITTYPNENVKLNFIPILPKTSEDFVPDKKEETPINIKTRLYKCLQCTEVFKSYKHLKEHERDLCKNKLMKFLKICKFCHKVYSKESLLNEHVTSNHDQLQFLCCYCQDNKVFSAKGYLSRHIEKAHKQKSLQYFCAECVDMICLPSQEEMRSHFLQKHPAETIKTDADEQTQTALNDEDMDLDMHEEFLDEFLLAHTNENSFQFSECWEALDLHLPDMLQESAANIHGFTQAFSCPKCYEQFKNPQPLLRHLADIHDLPVLICRVCNKCFASFKDFKRHKMQQCSKNSALQSITLDCPYCNKKFKNSINLKQHLRIVHCQIKKHICQLCDKMFSTLDHLKKHVLSQHQNERKHVCTLCDKKFTQLGHLKQHLAIHTTGKTIQCLDCSSKFWRKIDLERHRQKHHKAVTQHK